MHSTERASRLLLYSSLHLQSRLDSLFFLLHGIVVFLSLHGCVLTVKPGERLVDDRSDRRCHFSSFQQRSPRSVCSLSVNPLSLHSSSTKDTLLLGEDGSHNGPLCFPADPLFDRQRGSLLVGASHFRITIPSTPSTSWNPLNILFACNGTTIYSSVEEKYWNVRPFGYYSWNHVNLFAVYE